MQSERYSRRGKGFFQRLKKYQEFIIESSGSLDTWHIAKSPKISMCARKGKLQWHLKFIVLPEIIGHARFDKKSEKGCSSLMRRISTETVLMEVHHTGMTFRKTQWFFRRDIQEENRL